MGAGFGTGTGLVIGVGSAIGAGFVIGMRAFSRVAKVANPLTQA
jgi:hypothetical protein